MAMTRGVLIGALVVALLEAIPPAWAASAHVIVDGPALLQQSPAQIEVSCGQPVRTKAVPPGDFRLPEGGIWRVYRGPEAQLDIDFDRSAVIVEWGRGMVEGLRDTWWEIELDREWHGRGIDTACGTSSRVAEDLDALVLGGESSPEAVA